MQHILISACSAGHRTSSPASKPGVIFTIICGDVDQTRSISGPDATIQDYFEHMVPRRLIGPDQGTTLLHTLADVKCGHSNCQKMSSIREIETIWPRTLNVTPETAGCSISSFNRKPLPLLYHFSVQGVDYEFVGRAHYSDSRQHFTCDREFEGRLFMSDDMVDNGDYKDIGPVDLIEEVDFSVQLIVYHRLSDLEVYSLYQYTLRSAQLPYRQALVMFFQLRWTEIISKDYRLTTLDGNLQTRMLLSHPLTFLSLKLPLCLRYIMSALSLC